MKILLFAIAATCLLASCVTFQRGGLFAEERDRVFVGYFDNQTFYRNLEIDLTERVVDEILSRPGLHWSSKEDAEVFISGKIIRVRQRVLSENANRIVTSQNTQITVEIEILDARTGEVIKKKRLTQRGEFVPELGETIDDARAEAFDLLARDIVRLLELDF